MNSTAYMPSSRRLPGDRRPRAPRGLRLKIEPKKLGGLLAAALRSSPRLLAKLFAICSPRPTRPLLQITAAVVVVRPETTDAIPAKTLHSSAENDNAVDPVNFRRGRACDGSQDQEPACGGAL
ncbi:hypothetical protein ZWY2020_018668 [Hordeum vulgare]|nr:hypothetical protein ZWY2020_018668 [Hordeum vulgare]